MSEQGLPVINMTNFFNRELYLYSLGDVRLPKPISLKKFGFLAVGVIIWTLPIFLSFGLIPNPFYLLLLIGPPIGFSAIVDKPWFGGRGIIDAVKVTSKYIFSPKCYTDFTVSDTYLEPEYYIEQYFWISRRRELELLADILEQRG